jgi:hypothetical protein
VVAERKWQSGTIISVKVVLSFGGERQNSWKSMFHNCLVKRSRIEIPLRTPTTTLRLVSQPHKGMYCLQKKGFSSKKWNSFRPLLGSAGRSDVVVKGELSSWRSLTHSLCLSDLLFLDDVKRLGIDYRVGTLEFKGKYAIIPFLCWPVSTVICTLVNAFHWSFIIPSLVWPVMTWLVFCLLPF